MVVIGKRDLALEILSPSGIASYKTSWNERSQSSRCQLNQFGYYNLTVLVIGE